MADAKTIQAKTIDAKTIIDTLVGARRGKFAAGAALGGLALVAGLAARALREPASASKAEAAATTPFDQAEVGEDEARTMLRAMVAATMADGLMDDSERGRLADAITASGLEKDGQVWLRTEMDDPADVDEIAERVKTPEQAVRIYAAARLAIDADTLQEREFLKMLAEALDVPRDAVMRLDAEMAA